MTETLQQFPPNSFAELRQLPALLSRGEVVLPMGKQSYRALCRMMDDPEVVAMNNITTLAHRLDVSAPTLTRLSKLLGYAGFPELQAVFRNHLIEPQHFYSAQAERLASSTGVSTLEIAQGLADESVTNITKTLQWATPDQLETATHWLASGSKIHLLGYRQSSAIASLMTYGLSMIRDNIQQLGTSGHGLSTGLSQVRRHHVVVLFSSSPYSKDTIAAARAARRQQARIIAITDSHLSPLNQWADISLMSPTDSQFYSNSFCGMVCLIETLLTLTAKALGNKAIDNLKAREQLISELNDEY